jgi:L-rhamnose mutarotase
MGLLPLTYTRPVHVDRDSYRQSYSDNKTSDDSLRSGRSGTSSGIPDALAFDKIMSGGTCPVSDYARHLQHEGPKHDANTVFQPCTVRDFMNYLIYIERAAENLQFYLWHQDYTKRFNEAASADIALAPEWTQTMEDEAISKIQKEQTEMLRHQPEAAVIFKGTDFEKKPGETLVVDGNPSPTPLRTSGSGGDHESMYTASNLVSNVTTYRSPASDAFAAAGVKAPCQYSSSFRVVRVTNRHISYHPAFQGGN